MRIKTINAYILHLLAKICPVSIKVAERSFRIQHAPVPCTDQTGEISVSPQKYKRNAHYLPPDA